MTEPLVEVAVTLPVPGRYHYRVPAHLAARARVGARVLVRFGPRKVTGVVVREHATAPPEGVKTIDLSDVLDEEPALSGELVELLLWVADYYEAPPGEVMKAALPAGSGVGAHAMIALTEAGRAAAGELGAALPSKQRAVLAQLRDAPMPAAGMKEATRKIVAALETAGLVERVDRRASARVRLKREKWVELVVADADLEPGRVAAAATDTGPRTSGPRTVAGLALAAAIARDRARVSAARSPKRLAVIERLADGPVLLADLDAGGKAAVRDLAKAGVVAISERERSLEAVALELGHSVQAPPVLTGEQTIAVDAILAQFRAPEGKTPVLLHGVTGSGKTEVYLRVIAEALDAGKGALVLVPEISLTPQLAARFRARFGDQVAILHSGLTDQARLGEWSRLRRGEARIAVGARSAVFAPLANIGVIVVDEEHDGSFKQDEGVRYHARDVALVRAQRVGAVCVLGSATPSLESYAHAERGQYRRLSLTVRPTARPMPEVDIIDLRTHLPDGEAMLSAVLREAIGTALAAGDQVILFLNRRGFATFVLCRACGHSFRCPHCSVSLTYHKHSDRLSCHYCGFQQRVPEACPSCKTVGTIERKGLGTEKIEAALIEAFPAARVARLDRDVASGAKSEAVLARVARREIDLLVGTQMVTKGHDFPGVTLVGVLCADTGLSLPDFRASERTFQLLAQVAGRAGRGERAGRVMIQTYRPTVPAVTAAAAHDYATFFAAESAERAEHGWPPHGRLIQIRIDGADEHVVAGAAKRLADVAIGLAAREPNATIDVLGPVPAMIAKLRGRTRWQIVLRGTDRQALRRVARGVGATELAASVRVGLDVDPMSML